MGVFIVGQKVYYIAGSRPGIKAKQND
jgi:hypothetical protein